MDYCYQFENRTLTTWSPATHKHFHHFTRKKIYFVLVYFRNIFPSEIILEIIALSIHAPMSTCAHAFMTGRVPPTYPLWPDFPRRLPPRLHMLSMYAFFDPHRLVHLPASEAMSNLLLELWCFYLPHYPNIANGVILAALAKWPYQNAEHSLAYLRFQFSPHCLPPFPEMDHVLRPAGALPGQAFAHKSYPPERRPLRRE